MADVLINNISGQLKNQGLYDDVCFKKKTGSDAVTLVNAPGGVIGAYTTLLDTPAAGVIGYNDYRFFKLSNVAAKIVPLPPIAVSLGMLFTFKNIAAGVWTITPDGAETIDGAASFAINLMESITVVNLGTEWSIL